MNYYNEIDPYCVRWLKNLIADGLIPDGDVDDRSIEEVTPSDLKGYTQCHFFAGIAGWSLALRLAGWPEDRPVWTGSCPCQPFSSAGKREGATDERHLWPAFYRLIAERKPTVIFGEQVASKLGREWLAAVRLDLEELGYACGASDLCVAGVGAPHVRQRLFWVGDSTDRDRRAIDSREGIETPEQQRGASDDQSSESGEVSRLGDASSELGKGSSEKQGRGEQEQLRRKSAWSGIKFVRCADNKARPIEPRVLPLADGVPGRVGQIRAYGNAIVPQVGAVFIQSFMEVDNEEVGDTLYG